jgi:hypothetical protein
VTGIAGEHGGRGGRVESNMMEELERGLSRTETKSREYRRSLGPRATASALSVGKPHKIEAKAFLFS